MELAARPRVFTTGPRRHPRAFALFTAAVLLFSVGTGLAQKAPLGAMYNADQQRDRFLAPSFLQVGLPATTTASAPMQLYLLAGDLERAFDRPEFRPTPPSFPPTPTCC